MVRIRVRHFGPIGEGCRDNDGWIEVKKVTVFIGNQGSGKSTIAKLISLFSWLEKDLFRSQGSTARYRKQNRAFVNLLKFHRIENYLNDDTEILYKGAAYNISYRSGENLDIAVNSESEYVLPKITYYPAERNFLSSLKSYRGDLSLSLGSASLSEFKDIFQEAKKGLRGKGSLQLPLHDVALEYDSLNDVLFLKGKDYRIQISEASSGFQSYSPVHIVAEYVSSLIKDKQDLSERQREEFGRLSADIIEDDSYTEDQKRILLSKLAKRFSYGRAINIIEEPEQNLYPSSQKNIIYHLLELNNGCPGNVMVLTTHSPYVIGYLTIAIMSNSLFNRANSSAHISDLSVYCPQSAAVALNDVVVYQFRDDGSVSKLDSSDGVLSDSDFLNEESEQINMYYGKLIDIEDELV